MISYLRTNTTIQVYALWNNNIICLLKKKSFGPKHKKTKMQQLRYIKYNGINYLQMIV